jgi:hypothetical protein
MRTKPVLGTHTSHQPRPVGKVVPSRLYSGKRITAQDFVYFAARERNVLKIEPVVVFRTTASATVLRLGRRHVRRASAPDLATASDDQNRRPIETAVSPDMLRQLASFAGVDVPAEDLELLATALTEQMCAIARVSDFDLADVEPIVSFDPRWR